MAGPCFNAAVTRGGYRWWYIDALSDDGRNGLTIIGFVGSVFSPYYKRARSKGQPDPLNHCAINVALYGTSRRWAMTERGRQRVVRGEREFYVGSSCMAWTDSCLEIDIDERCAPIPLAINGRVKFVPEHIYEAPVALDRQGRHSWQAVAPKGRVLVDLQSPALQWSGSAYHDMNWGNEPLEDAFANWTWLRTHGRDGTKVIYEVQKRDGERHSLGKSFDGGYVRDIEVPQRHRIKRGFWGMERHIASEAEPRLLDALEDAPFYTRGRASITLGGQLCEAFHESLSLDRFCHPLVQLMLPFRMPRIA